MLRSLPGKRVLVVEDNPALAFDMDDVLRDVGVEVVGPALDLGTAMQLARDSKLDGAVLDIDLCGEMVWPLAEVLNGHQVPIVFVSADCSAGLPEGFQGARCVSKPAPAATVLANVAAALERR